MLRVFIPVGWERSARGGKSRICAIPWRANVRDDPSPSFWREPFAFQGHCSSDDAYKGHSTPVQGTSTPRILFLRDLAVGGSHLWALLAGP